VLDSGHGYFCRVDPDSGKAEQVVFCPGLARGLSFWRGYALIGTSLPHDGAFKGLELDGNTKARDGEPRCGAYIVDTRTGDILHSRASCGSCSTRLSFRGSARRCASASAIRRCAR